MEAKVRKKDVVNGTILSEARAAVQHTGASFSHCPSCHGVGSYVSGLPGSVHDEGYGRDTGYWLVGRTLKKVTSSTLGRRKNALTDYMREMLHYHTRAVLEELGGCKLLPKINAFLKLLNCTRGN